MTSQGNLPGFLCRSAWVSIGSKPAEIHPSLQEINASYGIVNA